MSAEIINLRKARKRKVSSAKERVAEQNRAKFGRTKSQKLRESLELERARRALDGAQREPDAGDER